MIWPEPASWFARPKSPKLEVGCARCAAWELYPAVASFHLASGNIQKAERYADKAQSLAQAGHNQSGEAEALRVQGEIHAAKGNFTLAERCLEQATGILRKLDRRYDLGITLRA